MIDYSSGISNHQIANERWAKKAPACLRDLILKKIALIITALLNFAALGTILYYTVTYCPVPAQAVLVSPYIVGVLGALTYVKFPTFGISYITYTNYSNPLSLMGRAITYLFFGPYMYLVERLDVTPYYDPFVADEVSNNLEKWPFDQIANTFGRHFSNLTHYDFIEEVHTDTLQELYEAYKPLRDARLFYREGTAERIKTEAEIGELGDKWNDLKQNFRLPHPEKPPLNFSETSTKIWVKLRSYCCFPPDLQNVRVP